MTEQRKPRLAWAPFGEGSHFHVVLYEGRDGSRTWEHRLTINTERYESGWNWEMSTTGVCFRSEEANSEIQAKLAAEDAIFGIAALLAKLFGINLELPETEGDEPYQRWSGPIHGWFGLSYCTHLVMPRTLLQGMPVPWQRKFVALLQEFDSAVTASGVNMPERYSVSARGADGKLQADPLPHYKHARILLGEKASTS